LELVQAMPASMIAIRRAVSAFIHHSLRFTI
jgi:hypothetical protein